MITYYWPPLGGSGVQRWLKFVKYLPQFEITPYVFTPENPAFDVRDESLSADVPVEAEVIRFPIWEPYEMFFRISGLLRKGGANTPTNLVSNSGAGFFRKLSTWARGNLLIPDPRVFWVRPSVKFLTDFVRDNGITTVITTGPPHSVHLIGYGLKKNNPSLQWLADFRDPWSEWGFLDTLRVSSLVRKIHRSQEAKVLKTADIVTTITPFYVRRFESLSGRKVHLLTNGYDETDFAGLAPVKTERFVIRHVGIVNEKCNPRPFMLALKAATDTDAGFAENVLVDFVGEVHPAFRAFVEDDPLLRAKTTFTQPVPHKELIALYNTSSLLLLVLEGYKDAEGYMPGKLFEYLATRLPVLGVGPEGGDAAQLITQTGAGKMVDGLDVKGITSALLKEYESWNGNERIRKADVPFNQFSRKNLTKRLVKDILGHGKDK